jgi:very-short-patch-repair endonuclease
MVFRDSSGRGTGRSPPWPTASTAVNVLVAGLEVDFSWPRSRLVVELDSRAYHTSPRAFERDRTRDAILLRAGCRVLRVTFKRLASDPAKVLEDVLALTNPNS